MTDVPSWLRLLLAVAITVGITLVCVWRFHDRLLHFDDKNIEAAEAAAADDEADDDGVSKPPPADRFVKPPETFYLVQRVAGLTATAFVFVLAFTLGNFWSNTNDARTATLDETTAYGRAFAVAESLPADQGGPAMVTALAQYRTDVEQVEWPLMRQADAEGAYAVQFQAVSALGAAVLAADNAGASAQPSWDTLTGAVDDISTNGAQRIAQVPNRFAPGMLWAIAVLGLANLVLAAMFQPARLGPNLVLMGLMAAITALLLFVVVEASNPFVGAGAVEPPSVSTPQ